MSTMLPNNKDLNFEAISSIEEILDILWEKISDFQKEFAFAQIDKKYAAMYSMDGITINYDDNVKLRIIKNIIINLGTKVMVEAKDAE